MIFVWMLQTWPLSCSPEIFWVTLDIISLLQVGNWHPILQTKWRCVYYSSHTEKKSLGWELSVYFFVVLPRRGYFMWHFRTLSSSINKESCYTCEVYVALFHFKWIMNGYMGNGRLLETCMFSHSNFMVGLSNLHLSLLSYRHKLQEIWMLFLLCKNKSKNPFYWFYNCKRWKAAAF